MFRYSGGDFSILREGASGGDRMTRMRYRLGTLMIRLAAD